MLDFSVLVLEPFHAIERRLQIKDSALPGRLYNLDLIRGLASLSVVIWHWQHFFYIKPKEFADWYQRDQQPLYSILFPLYEHGAMAVALFFVLSGFVFFWVYERQIVEGACSPWNFFVFRFARLYPLHFLTLNIVALLQYVYYSQTGDFFTYPFNDLYHYVLHLFFASDWRLQRGNSFNAPIWSVSIEILLYALFFLICYTRQTSWWKLLLIVGVAFSINLYRATVHAPAPRELQAAEGFFIGGLTYYMMHWYVSRRKAWVDWTIIGLSIVSWLSIAIFPFAGQLFLRDDQLAANLTFALTIAAFVILELHNDSIGKKLSWIGDTTYSTYLLHFPLQLMMINTTIFLKLDRHVYLSPWTLLLFFLILMPAAVGCFIFFERPMQSWIRRRALPRPRVVVSVGA